jgi:hypothetical protein
MKLQATGSRLRRKDERTLKSLLKQLDTLVTWNNTEQTISYVVNPS